MMQIIAFSAAHPNRFLALSFHLSLFFLLKSSTLTTPFYLHHHFMHDGSSKQRDQRNLDFAVRGLALETWQDIGNAHGCLYKRIVRFMAAICFLGSSKSWLHIKKSSVQGGAA
ncbi:hypothetical protein GGI43DRAFT_417889 [Trichoderma evansii]